VQRGSNRNPNRGRVLTERGTRTCALNGVEVSKNVGRTLRIDYVFFLVHEIWLGRLNC